MVELAVPTLKADATTYPEYNIECKGGGTIECEGSRCCGDSDENHIWLKDELALELCVSSRMSRQKGEGGEDTPKKGKSM